MVPRLPFSIKSLLYKLHFSNGIIGVSSYVQIFIEFFNTGNLAVDSVWYIVDAFGFTPSPDVLRHLLKLKVAELVVATDMLVSVWPSENLSLFHFEALEECLRGRYSAHSEVDDLLEPPRMMRLKADLISAKSYFSERLLWFLPEKPG